MEIKITTTQILQFLNIIAWMVFIGLCIEAGSYVFNLLFTLFQNSKNAHYLQLQYLFALDKMYYVEQMTLITIVGVLKAILFYVIVRIFHHKQLSFEQPFTITLMKCIQNMAYLSIGISLFAYWGAKKTVWFSQQNIPMPSLQVMNLGGADVWLFMGIVLLILAQIFKKGIELQHENELTI